MIKNCFLSSQKVLYRVIKKIPRNQGFWGNLVYGDSISTISYIFV